MTRESIDELRERLLRDERVLDMIRIRAFEIYQLRGGAPGQEAEDWFRAEVEVIGFWIDQESRNAAEASAEPPAPEQSVGEGIAEGTSAEKKTKKGASTRTPAPRKKKAAGDTENGGEEGGEKKKTGKRATTGKSDRSSKPGKTKSL